MSIAISRYFTSTELIHSDTAARLGIENTPSFEVACTAFLAAQQMDRIRELLGTPILISSWIRSLQLNRELGSSDKSQHIKGEAIDFTSPRFGSAYDVAKAILERAEILQFDQLILEFSWVHISFAITPVRQPRKEVLTLVKSSTGTSYVPGLLSRI